MSRPQPLASPEIYPTSVWNYDEVVYPTDQPGTLAVGLGSVERLYRLDFDPGGDPRRVAEGMVNVACFHRVAGSSGAVWEARTCFHPDLFVHRLLDLNSLEGPQWEYYDERA